MKKEVFAIYFPSWHPDKHYEKWYGKGFSEWELVKTTKPLFKNHKQPRVPAWGYFDESDPEMMKRQIDLAADSGITGFIFDWYWYDGVEFLEKPLNEAFLNAPNRNRVKFAIMWANHDWGIWPALDNGAKGMNGNENQASCEPFLKAFHSEEDLRTVMEYSCEKYFKCENYWKIDGKPVYSIYNCNRIFQDIAPADVLKICNEVVRKHGFPGIYTMMNIGCCNDNEYFCGWGRIPKMREAGFDSVFAYNSGVKSDYEQCVNPGEPTIDYSIMMRNQRHCYEQIAKGGMPFFPSVTLGLDVSPRWSREVKYPWDYEKLGYYPIMVNNTPDRIAELLRDALSFDTEAVIINAWNEWTEGMFLLPDNFDGSERLDKIKEILEIYNQ